MIGAAPKCYECKHFQRKGFDKVVCPAFPKGIPSEIFFDGEDHSKPRPGQIGKTVFEPIKESK